LEVAVKKILLLPVPFLLLTPSFAQQEQNPVDHRSTRNPQSAGVHRDNENRISLKLPIAAPAIGILGTVLWIGFYAAVIVGTCQKQN
jgi:hypothetical protein